MKKYIKFYRYLLPFWKREALILFLSVITVGLSLINPYLTKLIIDKAYGNKDLKLFIILISLGAGIFILNGLIDGLVNYLNRYIRLRINFNLSRKVFEKLQSLPYSFFQDSSTGEHLYKISYDIEQASRFVADVLPQAISLIPKSLFILAIIFYLNYKIATLALVLMPILYLAPYYFSRRLKKTFKAWIENAQNVFKRLHEVLSHMQLVKAFGKEKSEIRGYIRNLVQNIRFNLKSTSVEIGGSFINNLANRMVLGLIIFYGGYQIIKGRMTLGSLTAITIYLNQLSGLQNSLAQFFQQLSLGSISCERLGVILEARPVPETEKHLKEIIFPKGDIQFKNVSFAYKSGNFVLHNLNFYIPGGSCISLVGPSGCGKTTIANLILRLYLPLNGQILIDGYDINTLKSHSLYQQIGIVLQEPYLWNDTVENNIRYGKEEANLKEIQEAARIACIDEFIDSLAQGYATIIGENACKISEGQKQRIAIARAIIKKPKILILDEALSCVEVETETKIIDNIRNFLHESTIIVVSHRPSTIKKTDLIYFLNAPEKIIIGRDEEMLRLGDKAILDTFLK